MKMVLQNRNIFVLIIIYAAAGEKILTLEKWLVLAVFSGNCTKVSGKLC